MTRRTIDTGKVDSLGRPIKKAVKNMNNLEATIALISTVNEAKKVLQNLKRLPTSKEYTLIQRCIPQAFFDANSGWEKSVVIDSGDDIDSSFDKYLPDRINNLMHPHNPELYNIEKNYIELHGYYDYLTNVLGGDFTKRKWFSSNIPKKDQDNLVNYFIRSDIINGPASHKQSALSILWAMGKNFDNLNGPSLTNMRKEWVENYPQCILHKLEK